MKKFDKIRKAVLGSVASLALVAPMVLGSIGKTSASSLLINQLDPSQNPVRSTKTNSNKQVRHYHYNRVTRRHIARHVNKPVNHVSNNKSGYITVVQLGNSSSDNSLEQPAPVNTPSSAYTNTNSDNNDNVIVQNTNDDTSSNDYSNNSFNGYRNGHWYQNGQRLYNYYSFDDNPISDYSTVNNKGYANASMPYFHSLTGFFPGYFGRGAQSLSVVPSGHFAFVGFDSYNAGYVRVVRFNLQTGARKVGPWFYGGHGQALAYDPKTDKIWDLAKMTNSGDSNAGTMQTGQYVELNAETLAPIYRRSFDMQDEQLGDTLSFDNQGNAYNAEKVYYCDNPRPQYQWHSNVYFKGQLSQHGASWKRMQGVGNTSTTTTQGVAYNNYNHKLYTLNSGNHNSMTSVNENKLNNGNANQNDVHNMDMHNQSQEPEGLSFDNKGYGYTMMHSNYYGYTRIMKSNQRFGNNQ